MKNNILTLLLITVFALSCKAQTIIALDDTSNYDYNSTSKPILRKDINNIRDSFIGVWQGVEGNRELTVYLYKLDGVPVGLGGARGEFFKDGIMGYYVYEENGVEIINCKDNLLNPLVTNNQSYGPIFGFTNDGTEMSRMRFVDYGIQIQNADGTYNAKRADADIIITNSGSSTLQANFKIYQANEIVRIVDTNNPIEPYNHNYSIPENLTLTKISDTPPPLD